MAVQPRKLTVHRENAGSSASKRSIHEVNGSGRREGRPRRSFSTGAQPVTTPEVCVKYHEGRTGTTLHGITNFLDDHPEFASLNDSTARKNIDAAAAAIDALGTEQKNSTVAGQTGTASQRDLRIALRQYHMEAIANAAQMAHLSGDDLTALSMPGPRLSIAQLIKAAQGMSKAAVAQAPALIAAGLPTDFVAQLDAATQALQTASDSQTTQTTRRITATAGLGATARQAAKAIKVLDPQVKKLAGKNQALLAGWRSAKRITPKPGLARGALAGAALADAQIQASAKQAATPAVTPTADAAPAPTTGPAA